MLEDFSTPLECYSRMSKQIFRESLGAYFQPGLTNFSCGKHIMLQDSKTDEPYIEKSLKKPTANTTAEAIA